MTELRFDQLILALGLCWLSICVQVWHHVRRADAMPGFWRVLFLRTQGPKLVVVMLRFFALLLIFKN